MLMNKKISYDFADLRKAAGISGGIGQVPRVYQISASYLVHRPCMIKGIEIERGRAGVIFFFPC
jgi:hypothetical protein